MKQTMNNLLQKLPNISQRQFVYLTTIASLTALLTGIFIVAGTRTHTPSPAPAPSMWSVTPTTYQTSVIQAKAYYVQDLITGEVLLSHNAEAQLPLASITKVMMALTAHELLADSARITVKAEFLADGGNGGIRAGEEWKLSDILDLTLVKSSNGGAAAIAAVAGAFGGGDDETINRERFVQQMNARARALNLTQTYFLNETGLDESDTISGGYGSARDVAQMMAAALQEIPSALEATRYPTVSVSTVNNQRHTEDNTNEIVSSIPGLLASKTGLTDLAGGNLVVIFDVGLNHPVAAVVLGSTETGRFEDMRILVEGTLAAVTLPHAGTTPTKTQNI